MNEEPKSIWKKSLRGSRFLLIWLTLLILIVLIFLIFGLATSHSLPARKNFADFLILFIFAAIGSLILLAIWAFIRWFFCWRNLKRSLFGLACLATLIALAYAEEDWRGWHAWNHFKHEWEAKGEKFDFASVIPSAVPDEQNFALTPVVASCYEMYFDKNGHEVKPRNTNVVDRLSILSWRDISYENQRE